MPMKVELFMQLMVNGRPIWRMARTTKPELTLKMTDEEYGKVLYAAAAELSKQVKEYKAKEGAAAK